MDAGEAVVGRLTNNLVVLIILQKIIWSTRIYEQTFCGKYCLKYKSHSKEWLLRTGRDSNPRPPP